MTVDALSPLLATLGRTPDEQAETLAALLEVRTPLPSEQLVADHYPFLAPDQVRATADRLACRWPEPRTLAELPPPRPVRYLVDELLLAGAINGLAGEDGTGKSTLALHFAAAIAGGLPALGAFPTADPRPVLIVSEEDDSDVLQLRLEALLAGMGADPSTRDLVRRRIRIHALQGFQLDSVDAQAHLLDVAAVYEVALVVFDPLASFLRGDENGARDARPVIGLWRQLVAQGTAVLYVAHLGKPREGGPAGGHRLRGSSAWRAASRQLLLLERAADSGLRLVFDKRSRAAGRDALTVDFAIETAPDDTLAWREARLMARLDPAWALTPRTRLTDSERDALKALDDVGEGGATSTQWQEVADLKPRTFHQAKKRLLALGYVGAEKVGVRMRRPVFRFTITGAGVAATIPECSECNASATPCAMHSPSARVQACAAPLKGRALAPCTQGEENQGAPVCNAMDSANAQAVGVAQ